MLTQYMLCTPPMMTNWNALHECKSIEYIEYNIEEQHDSCIKAIIAIISSEAIKIMHSTNILIALAITSMNWCVLLAKGMKI